MILPDQAAKLAHQWAGRASGEQITLTDAELAGLLNEVIASTRKQCAGECVSACDVERILSLA